jgi:phosphatidylserine/phosphatidylglycerophosphate/cardiolipin synthase-like enzyme
MVEIKQVNKNIIIGKEFADKVIELIKQSKNSIDIIVYDWKWYPDQIGSNIQKFNNEIINAVKRNKRVRVITNSEKTIKILEKCGVEAKRWASKKNLHTKLMIIDNEIVILGSHNYTMNAFNINYEVSIIIEDEKISERLKTYFQNLW